MRTHTLSDYLRGRCHRILVVTYKVTHMDEHIDNHIDKYIDKLVHSVIPAHAVITIRSYSFYYMPDICICFTN